MPTITGTAGADTLSSSGENDTILAGAGNDLILGAGLSANSVVAGDGDDRIQWGGASSFPLFSVDGGNGFDTLDFSSFDGASYFFSRSILIRDGEGPNTIEGRVDGFERDVRTLPKTFFTATGIERIDGGIGVDFSLGRFTANLEIHGRGSASILTGSGDDRIFLESGPGGGRIGSFTVDGGAGSDTLYLEKQAQSYLIQAVDGGFTIYDGRLSSHQVRNMEQVVFAGGPALSLQQATAQDFDAAAYLARYADLRAAFGADEVKAYRHFFEYGQAEGRVASAFDGLSYIASYPDLIRAFGADSAAGVAHYQQYGMAEGRTITFDGQAYAAAWVDLAQAFGTDTAAAARHYITYGLNEGRATSGFDTVGYLLSNPDVAASLAFTPTSQVLNAARTHWLTYGADEGRPGEGAFDRDQSQSNPILTPLNTAGQSVTNGVFERAGDKDWFFANLPTRTTITVDGSDAVTSISVYDVRGKLLLFDADGRGASFLVPVETSTAAAGSVYIVVTSTGTGGYTLTTSRATAQTASPTQEDGDLANAANALAGVPPAPYGEDAAPPRSDDTAVSLPWLETFVL
jgi:hypothetical protein